MTHEQKPENARFRTREAHRQHIAQAWQDEGMSHSLANAWADRELSEAEARGAAEQRRKSEIEDEAENARFADADEESTLNALMRRHGINREEASEELNWWQERDKRFPLNKAEQRRKDTEASANDTKEFVEAMDELLKAASDLLEDAYRETALPATEAEHLQEMRFLEQEHFGKAFAAIEKAKKRLTAPDEQKREMIAAKLTRPANVAALEARVKELEGVLKEAARALEQVTDGERGGYNARNGKFVCLRMSDGERADIIHSEVTEDCERALVTVRAAIREGGEHG
ncbi:hypothetical protein [Asaia bogorensis]|uniref:Uncharacterized protein n=1 Tax=Asaia bogorensis NBRC 16594 TaxID=1231624 RepID=A0AAN4R3D9_9PROT|nr:hypothetical protein [Asaia bogorensis]BAT19783.1 hypothetical protein Asbog_01510 [Asaia bogorensis NBRC 16594]GBQ77720.1 hypothetical protein AA0311_1527 [Asaia bogorensis NBRC 16594]GEL54378.1 hypothetical protein ABO01nite_23850 [Asaia bogorensis NBRC 16594]